jgi:hypothetical protein
MSDPPDFDELESEKVRAFVRRALSDDALVRPAPDIWRGVQRRLRKSARDELSGRGMGKSQARQAYVIIAAAIVLLAAVAYFGLVPLFR